MLGFVLNILKEAFLPILYIGGFFVIIASIIKRPEWGLYMRVAFISSPNVYYKLYDFPMGKDFLDFVFLSVFVGMLLNKKGFLKNVNSIVITFFILISYLALLNCSTRFNLPFPLTRENPLLEDWKNYAEMICMYFLVVNVIKNDREEKTLVLIMTLMILIIVVRSYRDYSGGSSFNEESRYGGPFETVGLGPNHFGAFIADYSAVLFGLFLIDKNKWRRWLYLAAVLFSLHSLFYSYSRGAYIAAFGVLVFFGLVRRRSLLIFVFAIYLAWQTILPASVVDRISMTRTETGELEKSAVIRLDLWNYAMDLYKENPIFGVGFGGFGLSVRDKTNYRDTHSLYMKMLSEQGIVGLGLLMVIFGMAFLSGWRLMKVGKTSFQKGLGLGFLGCVVAVMITNIFGERWSYDCLGTYFWVFWALVDRGILISKAPDESQNNPIKTPGASVLSKFSLKFFK